jgi:hypothetical protein
MITATLTLIFWIVTVHVSYLIGKDGEYSRGFIDGVKEKKEYENDHK